MFLVFIFFNSEIVKSGIPKLHLANTIIVVVFLLSILYILSLINGSLFFFLPTLNIITLSYGHSHLSALLLIVIPIVWFKINKINNKFNINNYLLVFFYVVLLLTLSRLSIIISLLSLPFLIKRSLFEKKKIRFTLISFVIFTLVIIGFVSFSNNCIFPDHKQQLCKRIYEERRIEYFRNSLVAFKDNIFFGYGPGTYLLISDKYTEIGKFGSSYAHNYFLQLLAETGLVAGIPIILLIFYVSKTLLLKILSNKKSIDYYLSLSFISIIFNGLMDFDWNIFFTFQISFIIAALVIKSKNNFNKANNLWLLIAAFVGILGFLSMLSKVLVNDKQVNLAVKIFPYNYDDNKIIIKNKSISQISNDKMLYLYQNDPDFLSLYLIDKSEYEQLFWYKRLFHILPSSSLNENYHSLLRKHGLYEQLGLVSNKALNIISISSMNDVDLRYETKREVAISLLEYANFLLISDDIYNAEDYFRKAYQLDKWVFLINEQRFINEELSNLRDVGHIYNKLEFTQQDLGNRSDQLNRWINLKFIEEFDTLNPRDMILFLKYFGAENLWLFTSNIFIEEFELLPENEWRKYYEFWYELWLILISENNDLDQEYLYILMDILFRFGEQEKAETIQLYLNENVLPIN